MVMVAMVVTPEGGERLLRRGEIAGLERLADRTQRIIARRGGGRLAGGEVLLEGGVGLLGGSEIAGLQRLAERLKVGLNLPDLTLPSSRRKPGG